MSNLSIKTKCPCGVPLSAGIKKPTPMDPSVQKILCPTCKSRFLITCTVLPDKTPRAYNMNIKIVELSERAKQVLQLQIDKNKQAEESHGETSKT